MRSAEWKGERRGARPRLDFPRSAFRIPHLILVLVWRRAWGVRVPRGLRGVAAGADRVDAHGLVLVHLAGLVLVPRRTVRHLGLHRRVGNARRVLEHELPAQPGCPDDTPQPTQA